MLWGGQMKCLVHKVLRGTAEGLFSYTVECFWCGAESGGDTMSPREALDESCVICERRGSYFVSLDRCVRGRWVSVRF